MKRRDFILSTATGSAMIASGNLFAFPETPVSEKGSGKFCYQSERKIPVAYNVDVVVVAEPTEARKFLPKHYLDPIPLQQIQLSKGTLVQNPGW